MSMVMVMMGLLLYVGAAQANLESEMKECGIPLEPLFTCFMFVQGKGGDEPSDDCCYATRRLLRTNPKCVCVLLKEGKFIYLNEKVTYNTTRALQLPSLCHASANIYKCKDLLNLSPNSPDAKMFNQFSNYTTHFPASASPVVAAVEINCDRSWRCHKRKKLALTAGLTSASFLLSIFLGFQLYLKRKLSLKAKVSLIKEREHILSANSSRRSTKLFGGKDMKKATNCFSKHLLLGSGGFGDVYKGFLDDGTTVAVKVAKADSTKSTALVLNEVSILSQVNHRSLVHLLGCCVELDQPMLVYEFIPNGTLHDHIHTSRYGFLSWNRRLKIAYQTAQGLAYLHSSAVPPIYHRDVKSSNILLDERLNAKTSDFGLSRIVNSELTHVTTCVLGTLGYLDPEYYRSYHLTDKSDVYSFAVVLLEIVTSQRVLDYKRNKGDVHLVVYVQHKVDEGKILDALDENLISGASQKSVETMKALCLLAIRCLQNKGKDRPSMNEVVEEIEYMILTDQGKTT